MKLNKLLLSFIFFCIAGMGFSQAPLKFNYQAVARDAGGNVLASQPVGLEISLHQSTAGGTIVYTETHSVTTSSIGLMNLSIGGGTVTAGNFSTIDWSAGPYFIEIGMDATGGTSYTTMGTQQLLSVPYALYAANSGTPGPAGPQGNPGVDGASFLSGAGVPLVSTGVDGDTYVDLVSGDTYTKSGGVWTATGNSLMGPQGATGSTGTAGTNGTNGASFLSGAGTPSAGTGVDGDTYVDLITGDTYTKAGGVWTATGNNLMGPTGATGATGTNGANGASFLSGTGAPGAGTGVDGDTYVDLITGDTYFHSGGVWTATGNSLMGPIGPTGAAGANGASFLSGAGAPSAGTGVDGDTYVDLVTGDTYFQSGGVWTATGNSLMGPQGIAGTNGTNGASWHTGTGVPPGAIGTINDYYFDTATGNYYLKTGASTWTLQGTINANPVGTAGGDLTGTYPNPTIANGVVNSAKITDGSILNADVNTSAGIVYSKLNLNNSIVNADINTSAGIVYSKLNLNNSIVTGDLTNGSVTLPKISTTGAGTSQGIIFNGTNIVWGSPVPGGAAGGDLTGTYPNPTITTGAVTSTKILDGTIMDIDVNSSAGIVYSKLNLNNSIVTGDLTNGSVTLPKISTTGAGSSQGIIFNGTNIVWGSPSPGGGAGGDLTGTYPNPTIGVGVVTSAKILDGTIVNADISAAASISYSKLNLVGSVQGSDIAAGNFSTTNAHHTIGNNDNTSRELRLTEPSGSGVNYTAFKSQAQAGDITYTLPSTAPTGVNQVLQVQAVAGNNATLNWGTINLGAITFSRTTVVANAGTPSTNLTLASSDILGIDMSAGTNFIVNLPAGAPAGKLFIIKIEFFNNAILPFLTIDPAGAGTIDGAANLSFGNAGAARRIYSDGAGNWYTW